ncbi:MAG: hypothetical protein CMJ90_20120 [Planctomycetes bacterium]|nr:hypothetical protein [Planctomycetota bacterium]
MSGGFGPRKEASAFAPIVGSCSVYPCVVSREPPTAGGGGGVWKKGGRRRTAGRARRHSGRP